MTPVARIKALYFATTKDTVQRDLDQAIDLFKTLQSDAEREQAAVYMDGLSQMRSEWGVRANRATSARRRTPRKS